MIIIAHRGNINGPSSLANHPLQIKRALDAGFDAEIDVWWIYFEYESFHKSL